MTSGIWRIGNEGAGARIWFVWRPKDANHPGGPTEELSDKRGHYRRFGSMEAAKRRADALNRKEGERTQAD